MLKIEYTVTPSDEWMQAVVRGIRNPYNSWDKSDSEWKKVDITSFDGVESELRYVIGDKDLDLMKKLAKAGDDHGKFLRMIPVICDITAPLYLWKELDQYKVGTVTDSCSTMHTIAARKFDKNDFSFDDEYHLEVTVCIMNSLLESYNSEDDAEKKKARWRSLIQRLPESYNQKRTWSANYQVLKHIYHARKGHRLSEWETFREWIRGLPLSVLITGEEGEEP